VYHPPLQQAVASPDPLFRGLLQPLMHPLNPVPPLVSPASSSMASVARRWPAAERSATYTRARTCRYRGSSSPVFLTHPTTTSHALVVGAGVAERGGRRARGGRGATQQGTSELGARAMLSAKPDAMSSRQAQPGARWAGAGRGAESSDHARQGEARMSSSVAWRG
jgi:hypothetical protein